MLLPQELFDIIVQQIGDDSNTLSACLLTCSGLAAPARARIFSTVRLTPPALRSRTTTRCQKFYSLVTSNPHLALLVKDLQIVEGNDRDFESGAVWVVKASRTLSLILPLLSLKRLSIQANPKLEWERLSRSFRAALKDVLCSPQLEVLRLRGIVLNAPSDLYDLLSMVTEIKALKGLSLSYKLRSSLATAISIPPGWRPQLQSLAFSDHYTSGHFARMLSTSNVDFSRLRSLSCSGLHSSHINALLKALPPQNVLESLNIWYPPSENFNVDIHALICPRLHRHRTPPPRRARLRILPPPALPAHPQPLRSLLLPRNPRGMRAHRRRENRVRRRAQIPVPRLDAMRPVPRCRAPLARGHDQVPR
ncbi:hypothetical protein C8R44DRAFT_294536 [Mycena epipterygia]|nr:hypothetical protein C8R44DRAFT_294536 [Mycena epipterygia]